jgi:hypothetical protein
MVVDDYVKNIVWSTNDLSEKVSGASRFTSFLKASSLCYFLPEGVKRIVNAPWQPSAAV